MAGTISQTLHRLNLGRKKSGDVKKDDDAKKEEDARGSSADGTAGALPDSPVSSGSGITPGVSPKVFSVPANVINAQEVGEKPASEKRSSWSFHFHKSKKLAKQPPTEFVCPISRCLMADPVIVASGESYERLCIQVWLQQGNLHCFKTGQTLEHHNLTPNIALRTAIQTWCGKHKVPIPQGPTVQHVTQLVEGVSRTAFVSDGSDPPTPSRSVADGRPGFNSDPARPGFGNDDIEPGSGHTQSPGDSGSYGLSPPNSMGFDERSERSQVDEVETTGRAGPTWASVQEKNGPLWTRRSQPSHSRMRSSGSRDSSRDFDRGPSSAEYTGSSGNGRSWHGSSDHGNDSSEWPTSTHHHGQVPRYVHSASANTLREDVESFHGRGRTPLPLERTPLSYGRDIGDEGQIQEGDGIEGELIYKLQNPQPLEQGEAAAEIRRLTRNTEPGIDYRLALCTPGLLAALLPLLQSRYVDVQVNAVAAMMNLSLSNENKIKIARAGVVPSLIELLKGRSDAAQEHAAGALFSLALNDENKMAIGVLGAIPPLIHALRSGPSGTQRDAAMALYHLSFAHINRGKLIKAGAVPILLKIVQEAPSDLVSRALLILSNVAAVPEGRSAIGEGHGVSVLVGLLSAGFREDGSLRSDGDSDSSSRGGLSDWAAVREHAAAALLQLSNQNLRFKGQALQAGAIEPLVALQERGTQRAKDKATALLNILRESANQQNGSGEALYSRAAYQRRVPRGISDGNSPGSGTYSSSQRSDSAQF
ncbi:hypothetical protein KC19_4G028500 [Ceratodon purpureus]|uniref:RING-type E3 ubiquitin transferase n=1 Tax=Ceratodon purpureus TaxID=3225 RepID=A0A8T0I736_CERPU|nr:hypothetical protein KC19_N012200 [Ceratodon purpureus]KAG0578511.1 hypothetical protein KC19_4G028500 [Ceratodon purpureus]